MINGSAATSWGIGQPALLLGTTARLSADTRGDVDDQHEVDVEVDAVVWATGYRPDYTWLPPAVLGASGWPVHHRGLTPLPGLGVLGLPWLHTRGSALLGWVGQDAAWRAEHLGRPGAHPHPRCPAPATWN